MNLPELENCIFCQKPLIQNEERIFVCDQNDSGIGYARHMDKYVNEYKQTIGYVFHCYEYTITVFLDPMPVTFIKFWKEPFQSFTYNHIIDCFNIKNIKELINLIKTLE